MEPTELVSLEDVRDDWDLELVVSQGVVAIIQHALKGIVRGDVMCEVSWCPFEWKSLNLERERIGHDEACIEYDKGDSVADIDVNTYCIFLNKCPGIYFFPVVARGVKTRWAFNWNGWLFLFTKSKDFLHEIYHCE